MASVNEQAGPRRRRAKKVDGVSVCKQAAGPWRKQVPGVVGQADRSISDRQVHGFRGLGRMASVLAIGIHLVDPITV